MSFWKEQRKETLLFWTVAIGALGYFIHPILSGVLFVPIAVYYYAHYRAWKAHRRMYNLDALPVPVSRSQEIQDRAEEERLEIALRRELVKDAMKARREMEESAARELRLLIENLKTDRNLSQDPEVRSIISQFNAHQIHGTANDYQRLLRMAQAKQAEITRYSG
jgi:hypothetical protein